ncbi:NAD(P)-dependent oxidoreductase [Halococcus sp. IIIV-5B]|uniref:NAD(P)-dependent oxidoreductase n=1 Tax=Halococcus sp. IIIV-5B TaxID=2321230 RepID=UPI000E707CEB|nr:SDR family oxidoreductase [Halococcus sp. IIIV-5B]RJT07111.1 SDR family oxidoreductase [Halococcus sp. IIIV-5B]
MKVVVFGATGRSGRRVVKRALDEGHAVTGIARTPSKMELTHAQLTLVRGDVLNYDSFANVFEGQDAIISTVGKGERFGSVELYSEGIENIIRAMETYGLSRLIAITSGGTYPGWDRKNSIFYELLIKRVLLRGEYTDMKRMEDRIMDTNLEWTVVRPSGLTDEEGTGEYRAKVGYSIPESNTTTRDDLAKFIVDELESNQFVREGVAVVNV